MSCLTDNAKYHTAIIDKKKALKEEAILLQAPIKRKLETALVRYFKENKKEYTKKHTTWVDKLFNRKVELVIEVDSHTVLSVPPINRIYKDEQLVDYIRTYSNEEIQSLHEKLNAIRVAYHQCLNELDNSTTSI